MIKIIMENKKNELSQFFYTIMKDGEFLENVKIQSI